MLVVQQISQKFAIKSRIFDNSPLGENNHGVKQVCLALLMAASLQ